MHSEAHRTQHVGWLRAAVLGANDGIVSTASLILGVAAASTTQGPVLVAGLAGLVAGAMSMAAGEYVSVSSQSDTERADIAREKNELATDGVRELAELSAIYVQRGLDVNLAQQVAAQLTAHDALGAHSRDELGISETSSANPLQAALVSALSFVVGAGLPLLTAWLTPFDLLSPVVAMTSLLFLVVLGALAAYTGGAGIVKGILRVVFWGSLAMAITAGVGMLFGVSV
ncbi:VIT family protein [Rhodoferax sp. AJA081-3]|uniref:VIT1/CCC1 transporter family protein n=1 Tax=Rhodoferax sp. AJA081-3 TaxID=2752316 RepID=UPI001ADF465A|nr:VIT family protein [Rhodoferax sp. AJA081-3]QTN29413.1 VIT family protein [Rhodoferax sp. AJA081-3]